jgi:fructoselysine-6-P-deglycase FrlB-like protein
VTDAEGEGLRAIYGEMGRQAEDARRSFLENDETAARLAASVRRTGRLVLLGMGGSHAINRVAEPLYRRAGIDAIALPVSELLPAPLPLRSGTVLLASQSGESGEIVAYLSLRGEGEDRFGLTLDPESTLARSVPSLVGAGGAERAFAATRSLTVSLALHARVLHELGFRQDIAWADSSPVRAESSEAAATHIATARAVVFVARGLLQGVAEAAALGLLELARTPAFALGGGQFRHGPLEALGADLAVVLLRAEDAAAPSQGALAEICVAAGSPTLMFDLSDLPPIDGVHTVRLAPCADLAAALAVLPPLQRMLIALARRRVADVGTPVRSTKITRDL